MINFMYMIENTITQLFAQAVGTWQGGFNMIRLTTERKALLVLFKIKKKSVRMLIHAPMNYVGVYIQKGDLRGTKYGKWECIAYHDSCWKTEIEHFLFQHGEDIHFCIFPRTEGFDIFETITNAIHVVTLDETQLDELTQVRKKKYS